MEEDFELLIARFIETQVGISEHFLSTALAGELKANLLALRTNNLLLPAATGNGEKLNQNDQVRGDVIYWLDRAHNDAHENAFLNLAEEFIRYLNMTCYAGITDCEFHYSLYETGSFYKNTAISFRITPAENIP